MADTIETAVAVAREEFQRARKLVVARCDDDNIPVVEIITAQHRVFAEMIQGDAQFLALLEGTGGLLELVEAMTGIDKPALDAAREEIDRLLAKTKGGGA